MSWLNNFTISSKIGLIIALLATVATGVVVFATMHMNTMSTEYQSLISRVDTSAVSGARATRQAAIYVGSAFRLLTETTDEGNSRVLAQANASREGYRALMASVLKSLPEKASEIEPVITQFNKAFETCQPALLAGAAANSVADNQKAAVRLRAECEPVIDQAVVSQIKLVDGIIAYAAKSATNLHDSALTAIYMTVAVLGIGLLTALGVAMFIATKGLSQPIGRLKTVMEAFANNDLNHDVPGAHRGDELGDIARTVEVFKVNAIEVARLRDAQEATEVARAAQRKADMTKLANDFEGAVGEIIQTVSSAATELEASANSLTSTAARTEELSTMVAAAAEEASTNVQSVASASEEMSSSVNEISRQVQESARIAGDAVSQAETTNARVNELSESAKKIGDVVKLISTIAEQTNLLALNATIEAARAGEAGRGFAVVASEVKALAEQTSKATGEIGHQIAAIQTATEGSVVAIREIGQTIGRISEISSTIAAAVEEQGAATQEISRNVQQAAQGTSEVAANISDVQRGSSETGSASSQVLSSAQSLSVESNRLKTEVQNFLATVRAA